MAQSHGHITGWARDGVCVLGKGTGTCLLIRSYVEILCSQFNKNDRGQ